MGISMMPTAANGMGAPMVDDATVKQLRELFTQDPVIPHGEDYQLAPVAPTAEYFREDPIMPGVGDRTLEYFGMKVRDRIQAAILARSEFDDAIASYTDIYEAVRPTGGGPWEGSCSLTTPDTAVQVDTVVARFDESLFGQKPFLKVTARHAEDADTTSKWVDYASDEFGPAGLNLPFKMHGWLTDEEIDGTKILHTYWKREVRKKKRRVVINERFLTAKGIKLPPENNRNVRINGKSYKLGQTAIIEEEEVVQNRFMAEGINVGDTFMFPADSTSIDTAALFGHSNDYSLAEVMRMGEQGLFDKGQCKKLRDSASGALPSRLQEEDTSKNPEKFGVQPFKGDAEWKMCKIDTGYTNLFDIITNGWDFPDEDLKKLTGRGDICFVMDRETGIVLSLKENPYHNGKRPYKELVATRRIRGQFYGYSLVGKLFDSQAEVDAVTRMTIDGAALANTKFVEFEKANRSGWFDKSFKPGMNKIDTEKDGVIKNVTEFRFDSPVNFSVRDSCRAMMQSISGASDTLQGTTSSERRPLGETNLAALSANIRHKMKVMSIMDTLTWLYNQFFDYTRQFMEDEETYRVIRDGREVTDTITLADLSIDCDVEAYSAALDPDESLKLQKAELVFKTLINAPFVQADPVRMRYAIENYLKVLDPEMDIDKFLGPASEAQAALDQSEGVIPPGQPGEEGAIAQGGTGQAPVAPPMGGM